jgi:hypothetical protein
MPKRVIAALTVMTYASGCATTGRSTLVGAGAGAGIGAGVGAMVDPGPKGEGRIRNVFIGATAGSLLGAGAGYLAHEEIESRERASFERGKKESEKASAQSSSLGEPVLLPAKYEARFVERQVRGNVFVPEHFEYVIVEPARWSR